MSNAKSQKKVSKPFSREQKFMVVLFVFLLFDIFTHFSHPAYKYYREFSKKVHDENTQFQKKILGDFIPVISLVASNGMNRVEVSTPNPSSPLVSSSTFKPSDPKENSTRSVSLPRGSNFFTIAGVPYISVCGFVYQVGDYFDGSPILYLNPICMETRNCRYQIVTETRSMEFSSQSQPQTEIKNNAP